MDLKNIGLILEGGGMRGLFTAGILDFFLEKNLYFNSVIGVSAGACHACSYLSRQIKRAYKTSTDYLNGKKYCSFYSLITTGDLFGADMLYNQIPNILNPIDNETFLKNSPTFQVVVTNCKSEINKMAEYPLIKDLKQDIDIIRASSSLPLLSRFVFLNENTPYLDGGISDSIPIKQSIKQGNQKNVIILTQKKGYQKSANKFLWLMKIRYRKYPNLIKKISNRHIEYNKTLKFIAEKEKSGEVFVFSPPNELNLKRIEKDKEKLQKAYDAGYQTAKMNFEDLLRFLDIKL